MAIRRGPPHPARGLIIWALLLLLLLGAVVLISGSVDEVPVGPIEVDVARPS